MNTFYAFPKYFIILKGYYLWYLRPVGSFITIILGTISVCLPHLLYFFVIFFSKRQLTFIRPSSNFTISGLVTVSVFIGIITSFFRYDFQKSFFRHLYQFSDQFHVNLIRHFESLINQIIILIKKKQIWSTAPVKMKSCYEFCFTLHNGQ